MSISVYAPDGGYYFYVVQTGQPSDPVQVGEGLTIQEAIADLAPTPIQSVGPDGGERDALEWSLAQSEGAPGYDELQFIVLSDELEDELEGA